MHKGYSCLESRHIVSNTTSSPHLFYPLSPPHHLQQLVSNKVIPLARSSPHPPLTATTWPLLPAPTLTLFSPISKLFTPPDYLYHCPLRRRLLRTRCVSVTLLLLTAKAHNSPFPAPVATLHLERLDGESLELPLAEHRTFCRLFFTSERLHALFLSRLYSTGSFAPPCNPISHYRSTSGRHEPQLPETPSPGVHKQE